MQHSQLERETNLLILEGQEQDRILTTVFCLNNKVRFLFERSLFSEQSDIKLMKIGLFVQSVMKQC